MLLRVFREKERALGRTLALAIELGVLVALATGAPVKKKLTAENILDLLTGGVAIPRVIFLIQDRGIDFQPSPKLDQAILDAGGNEELIQAIGKQLAAPEPGSATVTSTEAPPTRTEPAPEPEKKTPSKPAPTTSPVEGAAKLIIRTKPGDADIFVDNELKGKTDPEEGRLEIAVLKPGKHRVRATREGYQDLEGTVELAAGRVQEIPIWLAKTEAPAPAAQTTEELPPGRRFLVRHQHRAFAGVSGPGYCQGWMIVNVGYVRYISTDSPHKYLINSSEMREAKPDSGSGNFHIKLDFGRNYQFVAINEKGEAVGAGPILTEISYSRGE